MIVRSISRTVKILEFLGNNEGSSVTEISKSLGLPKSTTHGVLFTLEKENIITKDRHFRYHLGLKLFELGSIAQMELEIRKVAAPVLKKLNAELDETVHLTVLD